MKKRGDGVLPLVGLLFALAMVVFVVYSSFFSPSGVDTINESAESDNSSAVEASLEGVNSSEEESVGLNESVNHSIEDKNESVTGEENESEVDNETLTFNQKLENALEARMDCLGMATPRTCPSNEIQARKCLDRDMVGHCEDEFNMTLDNLGDSDHKKFDRAFFGFEHYLKAKYYCVEKCSFHTYRKFYAYECVHECKGM